MKHLICFVILFTALWVYHPPAKAPIGTKQITILGSEPIYPYNITDSVLRAFVIVESNFKADAYNKISGARGLLQITKAMIREVNRILRKQGSWKRYTFEDTWSVEKSIEIWYIVQTYHNPEYDVRKACKIWFGTGVQYDGMTWKEYYIRVQKHL